MKARRWKMMMFLGALIAAGLLVPGYARIIASSGCHDPARPKHKKCWEYGYEPRYDGYVCFVGAYNPSAPSWVVIREGFDHQRGSSSAGHWARAELIYYASEELPVWPFAGVVTFFYLVAVCDVMKNTSNKASNMLCVGADRLGILGTSRCHHPLCWLP